MLLLPCLIAFLAVGQDLHSGFTVRGDSLLPCAQTDIMKTPGAIDHIDSSAQDQNSYLNSNDPSVSWKSDATNAWIAVSFKRTQRVWAVQIFGMTGVSNGKITLLQNGVGTPVHTEQFSVAYRGTYKDFPSGPLADTVKIELVPDPGSTTVSVEGMFIPTCPPPPCNQTDFVETPGAVNYIKSSAPDQNSYLIFSPMPSGTWTSNATNPWITVSFPTTKLVLDVYTKYVGGMSFLRINLLKNGVEVDSKQFSTNTLMIGANYPGGLVADTVKLEFAKHPDSPEMFLWPLVINTCDSPQKPAEEASALPADAPSEGPSDVPTE